MAKDRIGQEIKVGDYIIYGHNAGRCATLKFGQVLKIQDSPESCDTTGNMRLRVQGIDSDFSGPDGSAGLNAWGGMRTAASLSKPGTLYFAERVFVLAPEQVPQWVKTLLSPTSKQLQEAKGPCNNNA